MSDDILDTKISYYYRCDKPSQKNIITIRKAFTMIKSNLLKRHTDYLRQEPDKAKRTDYKAENLPAVIFQGTFSYRKNDKLLHASGLAVLDIDDCQAEIDSIKEQLKCDEYVLAFFTSPSGGLKVLVRIPLVKDDAEYKIVFEQLLRHYNKYSPKTDDAGKDISRLCFLSYDPEVFVK